MTETPTVTHVHITRKETYDSGRFASIDTLREYLPDLDVTGMPVEKIGEHIEDAIFNVDDRGQLNEWIEKHSECTDSETTVTPFVHVCACGQPLIKSQNDWIDPDYGMTCDGTSLHRNPDARKHAPTVPPAPEPEPVPVAEVPAYHAACKDAGLPVMAAILDVVADRESVAAAKLDALTPEQITNLYESCVALAVDDVEDEIATL